MVWRHWDILSGVLGNRVVWLFRHNGFDSTACWLAPVLTFHGLNLQVFFGQVKGSGLVEVDDLLLMSAGGFGASVRI